jgi:hypothetical protein
MKKRLLSGFLALFLLGSASLLRAAVEPGQAAPDVSFTDIDGKTHKLADFKGKTVVLEWVNPECPFVKYHYEKAAVIPALQKEAASEGIVWVSINSGHPGAQGDFDEAAVKAWISKTGASPAAYVRDSKGEIGKLFDAKTTPHLFIINGEGTLVYEGAIDNARGFDQEKTAKATNYVRSTLAALKEGKPVSPATSQPYGCSVKY